MGKTLQKSEKTLKETKLKLRARFTLIEHRHFSRQICTLMNFFEVLLVIPQTNGEN